MAVVAIQNSNVRKVLTDEIPNTWGLLFDEKYLSKLAGCGVALGVSPLQTYSTFMLLKARNLNLTANNIKSITNDLIKLKAYYKNHASSNLRDELKQKNICVAFGWVSFYNNQDDIVLLEPEEGIPMYIDVWAIPAHAKNVNEAHKFIDFTLRPEVAAQIVNHTNSIVAVNGVKNLLDNDIAQNKYIFPSNADLQRAFLFQNLNDEQKDLLQKEWQRFKQ